ncbi:hypothetical protein B0H10DRAFT_908142 [Mycena sp. CBHHK59/15]|nr:hypothetical protein B0H10DRAFT_908142 [Mycena sp. CBHHK59/15]
MTLRFTHSTASARGGTARWQAPELLHGESPNHFGSDIYAFACVCYEVCPSSLIPFTFSDIAHFTQILTGKAPFYELLKDVAVILKVIMGERPLRPASWPETTPINNIWILLQDCWEEKSETRPTAAQIVQRLAGPPIDTKTSQSSTDWNESYTSKFRRSLRDPLLPSVSDLEYRIFGDEVAEACAECFPEKDCRMSQESKVNKTLWTYTPHPLLYCWPIQTPFPRRYNKSKVGGSGKKRD